MRAGVYHITILFFLAWSIVFHDADAQQVTDPLWKPLQPDASRRFAEARFDALPAWNRTSTARYFQLNTARLKEVLDRAVREPRSGAIDENARRPERGSEITIPMPDGSMSRFRIQETQLLAPRLAAKYPEIRTFRGQGIDDPSDQLRFEATPRGLTAQVLTERGTVLVDPVDGDSVHSVVRKQDLRKGRFRCLVQSPENAAARPAQPARPVRSGTTRRTYRLAIACTREYARFHGRGVPAGQVVSRVLAAIATTVNRVDGIYERELAVRLQLVDRNDQLIFTDATPQPQYPFSTDSDANVLIGESQRVIDSAIGNDNYDVGHTFSTGAGGLAGLGVVCRQGQKARGVTGSSSPVGDAYDVDYVAHELGHEFGGNHSFNGSHESCSGRNRNGPTACEPGSGSTIQGYAGICGPDDLQAHSDDYFHSVNLDEMIAYTTTGPGAQVAPEETGNNPPTVRAPGPFVIPHGTPFALTATGSDPDGDPITYCWEERDLGPQADLIAADDGQIPLFRSARPTASPTRFFPRLSTIVAGTADVAEKTPFSQRQMRFRVTVRDNRGGIAGDDATVSIASTAGPFRVISPRSGTQAGLLTVTWDVAATDQAPINVHFVDILLSTDGGATFPATLASNVPNSGQYTATLPSLNVPTARVMIRSVGNIFFAVSPSFPLTQNQGSFLIASAPAPTADPRDLPSSLHELAANAQVDRVLRIDPTRGSEAIDAILSDPGSRSTLLLTDPQNLRRIYAKLKVPNAAIANEAAPLVVTVTAQGTQARPLQSSTHELSLRRAAPHEATFQGGWSPMPAGERGSPLEAARRAEIKQRLDSLQRQLDDLRRLLNGPSP